MEKEQALKALQEEMKLVSTPEQFESFIDKVRNDENFQFWLVTRRSGSHVNGWPSIVDWSLEEGEEPRIYYYTLQSSDVKSCLIKNFYRTLKLC